MFARLATPSVRPNHIKNFSTSGTSWEYFSWPLALSRKRSTGLIVGNSKLVQLHKDANIHENGAVYVEGDTIMEVGTTDNLRQRFSGLYPSRSHWPSDATYIDARGKFLLPGFICAHGHFYGMFARGMALKNNASPKNFREVLEYLWWKLDKALLEGNATQFPLLTYSQRKSSLALKFVSLMPSDLEPPQSLITTPVPLTFSILSTQSVMPVLLQEFVLLLLMKFRTVMVRRTVTKELLRTWGKNGKSFCDLTSKDSWINVWVILILFYPVPLASTLPLLWATRLFKSLSPSSTR